MGVTAIFTLVTRDRFEQLRTGRDPAGAPEPQVYFDVDRSWAFFDSVFRSFGGPLSKVFEGDYLPHGLWQGGGHLGYISPELVLEIGNALVGVEPERLFARAAEAGEPLDPDRQVVYRDFFFEIKIGFRVAARCGGGLKVSIS